MLEFLIVSPWAPSFILYALLDALLTLLASLSPWLPHSYLLPGPPSGPPDLCCTSTGLWLFPPVYLRVAWNSTCPQLKPSFSQNLLSVLLFLNSTNGEAQKCRVQLPKAEIWASSSISFSSLFSQSISNLLSSTHLWCLHPGHFASGWLLITS